MRDELYEWDPLRMGLPVDEDARAAGSPLLTAAEPLAGAPDAPAAHPVAATQERPPSEPVVEPAPTLADGDGVFLAEAAPELLAALASDFGGALPAAASADEIDPVQILRDRPDVYAGFYRAFHGPNNDRHSPAWSDRVGGETPEDYARYWYQAHGRYEGYTPSSGVQGAPAEGAAEASVGRTTIDGIPLSKILADRPDVFQAFFTEYYGPGNDRSSDAWAQRVGGATDEDYANYWYNAHGRVEGYVPSWPATTTPPASEPDLAASPDAAAEDSGPRAPPREEDPSLDPWNHPAIYPDWQPPYPGWQAG